MARQIRSIHVANGSNNAVLTGQGDLIGVSVNPGSGAFGASGVALIYDAATVTGNPIMSVGAPGITLGGDWVRFNTGLSVNVTGTAATATVYYVR